MNLHSPRRSLQISPNVIAFPEIASTINYMCYVISASPYGYEVSLHAYTKLHIAALYVMHNRIVNTWRVENPTRGNAFRAITKEGRTKDAVLKKIEDMAMGPGFFDRHFPGTIYFWTDPKSAAVRVGDYLPILSLYPCKDKNLCQPWTPSVL